MKRALILTALLAGACNSGNAGETPAQPQPRTVAPRDSRDAAKPTAAPAAAPKANAAQADAGPTIPAGARWTIFCDAITTDDHVARATALKEALVKNSRARDWYVIHQAGQSSIYLGYYKERDVAAAGNDKAAIADAQRAKANREIVEALPNPTVAGRKLFPRAAFVPLDAPDAAAPPEWSLTNAPGYFSVQIAAFTGPDRKFNCVSAVRDARAMNVPAFYYHGNATSSLCVGSWPAEAIKRQDAGQAESTRDENETIIVNMTGTALTPEERKQMGASGNGVREFESKVEILDPTLVATLKQYDERAVDGEVETTSVIDKRTGKTVRQPKPSFIIEIPRGQTQTASARDDGNAAPPPPPTNAGGSSDLGRRLRGIAQ